MMPRNLICKAERGNRFTNTLSHVHAPSRRETSSIYLESIERGGVVGISVLRRLDVGCGGFPIESAPTTPHLHRTLPGDDRPSQEDAPQGGLCSPERGTQPTAAVAQTKGYATCSPTDLKAAPTLGISQAGLAPQLNPRSRPRGLQGGECKPPKHTAKSPGQLKAPNNQQQAARSLLEHHKEPTRTQS